MQSFVERPGELTLRAPILHQHAVLRAFVVDADRAALQRHCDIAFNQPSGGTVTCRPAAGIVVLTFTTIKRVQSTDARDHNVGWGSEVDVGFWAPLDVSLNRGPARRMWIMPHLVVDNPWALINGREHFGFPKTVGTFQIPEEPSSALPYTVDTMVLRRHGPDTPAETTRLFEVRRIDATSATEPGLFSSLGELRPLLSASPSVPMLFLRQLRDVQRPELAAFQEIVEAEARVVRPRRYGRIRGAHELTISPCDSHPIAYDLGLRTRQPVRAAFWLSFDFMMERGRTLWSSAAQNTPSISVPAPRKRKIAVLGGGLGALSAAFELTADPARRRDIDVTVYQMGWRLGGKGASGRNAAMGQRIEEHGLHVFFGFYERCFDLMRRCYDELQRPHGHPHQTWQHAFTRQDLVVLQEPAEGGWRPWPISFPRHDGLPGDDPNGDDLDVSIRRLVTWTARAASLSLVTLRTHRSKGRSGFRRLRSLVKAGLGHVLRRLAVFLEDGLAPGVGKATAVDWATRLAAYRRRLTRLLERAGDADDDLRRALVMLDLSTATLVGIARDRLVERGFRVVDDEDLRDWLARHGAGEATLSSAPIRAVYDLAFAYEGGDITRPSFAAGSALLGLLKLLFAYRGSFMWKMEGGMGDVIFAPLYEVLRRRGVRFEFFHRVRDVRLSADAQRVETILIDRQANIRAGEYLPLVDVKGVPSWPSAPLFDQLEGESMKAVAFERARTSPVVGSLELRAGRDFDDVVLGIALGALSEVCSDIVAKKPSWQSMVTNVKTTATQAYQFWLNADRERLGWASGSPRSHDDVPNHPIVGAYIEPVDTWADMSHLVRWESWSAIEPTTIVYLCGVLPDADAELDALVDDEALHATLMARTRRLLDEQSAELWPHARHKGGFDEQLLFDPQPISIERASRLDAQYARSNVEPTERYVQSVKGSTKYRLRSDESGVANLWLAGDWTKNDICAGCAEAAASSGIDAARALLSSPIPDLPAASTERARAAEAASRARCM